MLYEKIKLAILTTLVIVTAISGFFEVRRIADLEQQVQMMQHIEKQNVHYNAHLIKSMVHRMEVK